MKIPNITEIIVAWHRSYNPTPEQKELAEQRAGICDSCEHRDFINITKTFVCGACKCPIARKVYSSEGPSACPKEKWTK